MKAKIGIALLFLLISSALTLYVFAQTHTDKQQGEIRKAQQNIDRLQEEKQKVVRDTLLIGTGSFQKAGSPQKGISLFLRIGEDGKVDHAVVHRPNRSISRFEKLRIEMLDGSVQEIVVKKIKKMTVE